jgi:hypothetical protein
MGRADLGTDMPVWRPACMAGWGLLCHCDMMHASKRKGMVLTLQCRDAGALNSPPAHVRSWLVEMVRCSA